jgi:tetraacyldisaccharide 4'-kinase
VIRALARFLEQPRSFPGVALDPVRRVSLPAAAVIGVGGATLGGSGRTPLAIAVARALDAVLVGHGYGGRVRAPRFVRADDDPALVGDEAILCARVVKTVVGPRQEAIAFAAAHARTVVVDRLLQTRPRRLSYSLLAVDAEAPRGSGTTLPFGDLLARRDHLLAACDEVVPVSRAVAIPPIPAGARVGVVTSMARPYRLRSALQHLDVRVFIERGDHAPLRDLRIFNRRDVDVWLIDQKTDVHLAGRRKALVIEHRVTLADDLLARLVLTSRAA